MLSSAMMMRRVAQPVLARGGIMGARGVATESSQTASSGSGTGIVSIAGFLGAMGVTMYPMTLLTYGSMQRLDSSGQVKQEPGLDVTKLMRQHMRENHNGRMGRESNEGKKDMDAWKRSDSQGSMRTEDNAHMTVAEASGQAADGKYLMHLRQWAGVDMRNVEGVVEDAGVTKGGIQRKKSITHFDAERTFAAAKAQQA